MDYIKNIFYRMNLQQICSFVLNGVEGFGIENYTYKEKLKKGSDSIYRILENLYKDEDEQNDAVTDLSCALTTYENVYTEIGMKLGARLVFELLHVDDFEPFDEEK